MEKKGKKRYQVYIRKCNIFPLLSHFKEVSHKYTRRYETIAWTATQFSHTTWGYSRKNTPCIIYQVIPENELCPHFFQTKVLPIYTRCSSVLGTEQYVKLPTVLYQKKMIFLIQDLYMTIKYKFWIRNSKIFVEDNTLSSLRRTRFEVCLLFF